MWSVAANSLPGQLVHVKQKIFTNFCCSELLRVLKLESLQQRIS